MTDYVSVRAKLSRAEKHLRCLESELKTWINSKPVSLVPDGPAKPHPDGMSVDFSVKISNRLPIALSVMAGDCIHNFRSALDHLAMALAIDNGGSPYDPSVSFPICTKPENFHGQQVRGIWPAVAPRGTGRYAIRALRPAAQAFIEGLQPYNGKLGTSDLTELQYLDNRDKHRIIIEPRLETLMTFFPPPGVEYQFASGLALVNGAYFATVIYQRGFAGNMDVQPPIPAGVCVERSDRLGFIEIQRFLRSEILPFVRDEIISEAERRFP
jgi:hypothetical protein